MSLWTIGTYQCRACGHEKTWTTELEQTPARVRRLRAAFSRHCCEKCGCAEKQRRMDAPVRRELRKIIQPYGG